MSGERRVQSSFPRHGRQPGRERWQEPPLHPGFRARLGPDRRFRREAHVRLSGTAERVVLLIWRGAGFVLGACRKPRSSRSRATPRFTDGPFLPLGTAWTVVASRLFEPCSGSPCSQSTDSPRAPRQLHWIRAAGTYQLRYLNPFRLGETGRRSAHAVAEKPAGRPGLPGSFHLCQNCNSQCAQLL